MHCPAQSTLPVPHAPPWRLDFTSWKILALKALFRTVRWLLPGSLRGHRLNRITHKRAELDTSIPRLRKTFNLPKRSSNTIVREDILRRHQIMKEQAPLASLGVNLFCKPFLWDHRQSLAKVDNVGLALDRKPPHTSIIETTQPDHLTTLVGTLLVLIHRIFGIYLLIGLLDHTTEYSDCTNIEIFGTNEYLKKPFKNLKQLMLLFVNF